jgi:hypothetical protein
LGVKNFTKNICAKHFQAGLAGRCNARMGKQWRASPFDNNCELAGIVVTFSQQRHSSSIKSKYEYPQRKKVRKNFLKKNARKQNFFACGHKDV